jgi:hypothetical protein
MFCDLMGEPLAYHAGAYQANPDRFSFLLSLA